MRKLLLLIAAATVCAGGLWAGPVSSAESAPATNLELRVRSESGSVWGTIYSVIKRGFCVWFR